MVVLRLLDAPPEPRPSAQAHEEEQQAGCAHTPVLAEIDTDEDSYQVVIREIDQYSAFAETSQPFTVGQEVQVTIANPSGSESFLLSAKVAERLSSGIRLHWSELPRKMRVLVKALQRLI